jgi:hypothetical protein
MSLKHSGQADSRTLRWWQATGLVQGVPAHTSTPKLCPGASRPGQSAAARTKLYSASPPRCALLRSPSATCSSTLRRAVAASQPHQVKIKQNPFNF